MLRIFNHYVPAAIVWLIFIELTVLFFSVYAGVELRYLYGDPKNKLLLEPLVPKATAFAIVMWLSMTAVGLHTRNVVDDFAGMMIRIFLGFALGFAAMTLLYYIYPDLFLGRGVFALALLSAFFSVLFTRTVYQKLDHHIFCRRILVLGTGDKAGILHDIADISRKRGHEIIGYVRIDNKPANSKILPAEILDIETTLLELAWTHDVDEIVLAMDDRRQGFPLNGLLECKMKGIVVLDIVHFLERVTGHIELDVLHPSVVIFSSGFTQAVAPGGGKRLFDVMASLVILILASPIMLLTAAAIWLSSFGRDPVFYRQVRIGLCDTPFKVLKFRSMRTDAEKDGAQFARKKDSRVTLIGAFIRKTRIDELPQLLNVLKGDMSFVGPRPERPEFVLNFEQTIPHYSLRHVVKPGITGWAQICYPYGDNIEDTRNKLQFDLYYIKNYSLFLDMTILFQTLQVVLFGQGAR
jgi:sugar transferase (PEP-CTERM system associated)